MDLDATDKRLLRAVQVKCTRTAEELGEIGRVSPSTAMRRIKRMRDAGVITAEIALVDPVKLGRPLQMVIAVRLERDNAKAALAFVRRMRDHPSVTQCYFVTGAADYIVHISARDMADFDAFVQTQLVNDPHVAMTDTNVVIRPVKVSLAVVVDD